ncbi:hypothetical protein EV138_3160 [Kribbella voronezhensis]|uniref:PH (Pleckstrin Homology) domain-containing protein n=1 Tax=Kribbella voronezhensis TaxID=2512212 RepID=A0A4R7TDK6_9ACTN|nr:hypothetical protein [Kribbella voronezhensis]TDU89586.1 hypothetical protein EV138_3160 [Kribbella voronezhensis]
MRTSYRMRAGRFVGVLAAGLIVLGVAAIVWAVGLPDVVVAVFLTLGGLVLLAGLWILAFPPVLVKLGTDDVAVRGLKTDWAEITEVGRVDTTQGPAVALRTKQKEGTIMIPLRWLAPGKADKLETELRDRLNQANGYTMWDGTAPDDADHPE